VLGDEFGIFLGRSGKNIGREAARSHIFGFCIFNDVSARDAQMREGAGGLGPAKGKDFATALGPCLVTLDELADKTIASPPGAQFDLKMTASINGKKYSEGNVRDMNWTFAQILERGRETRLLADFACGGLQRRIPQLAAAGADLPGAGA